MNPLLTEISETLQKGRAKQVKELVQKAIDEKIDAKSILEDGLLAGMSVIGEKFKNNEVYVPEVLIAARAMNAGTELLKPLLGEAGAEKKGKVVLGTVKGDLHDIGKNLVALMMKNYGFQVIDLGKDVAPQEILDAVLRHHAPAAGLSALMTTTVPAMQETIALLKEAPWCKVVVGGAVLNQEYADRIGADRYAKDAMETIRYADKVDGAR